MSGRKRNGCWKRRRSCADLDDFARLSELLRGLPRESAPPELAAVIRRQAEQKALLATEPAVPRRSLRREMISALIGVAATVLAVVLVNPVLERNRAERMLARNDDLAFTAPSDSSTVVPLNFATDEPTDVALHGRASLPDLQDGFFSGNPAAKEAPAPAGAVAANGAALSDLMPGRSPMLGEPVEAGEQLGRQAGGGMGGLGGMGAVAVNPKNIRIGDMLPYFEKNSDGVSVVELIVVDKEQVADQLHLICERNQFSVIPEDAVPASGDQSGDRKAKLATVASEPVKTEIAQKLSGGRGSDVVLIYLQASSDNMAQLLEDLDQHTNLYVDARVQPPVDRLPVEYQELSEEFALEQAGVDTEGVIEERETELAKSEANAILKNYSYQQRQLEEADNRDKSASYLDEAMQRRAGRVQGVNRDSERERSLRRSIAEPELRDPVDALFVANSMSGLLPPRQQNAIAVEMHLTPEAAVDGEPPISESKSVGDLARNSLTQRSRFSVSAEVVGEAVKKNARAEKLAEKQQSAESPVRVLLVVKQAPSE